MTAITIAPLSPDHLGDAARLLAAAFEADPLHRAAYRADVRRRSERFYRARLAAGDGGPWYAASRGGELLGVIHWLVAAGPAGSGRFVDGGVAHQLGWVDRGAAAVFRWLAAARVPPTDEDAEAVPPVTLGPVAVVPALQRRGIGSQLMRRFCDELDTRHEAGYLETAQPGHVTFYQRHGFSVVDEIEVQGVICVAMRRPPP